MDCKINWKDNNPSAFIFKLNGPYN